MTPTIVDWLTGVGMSEDAARRKAALFERGARALPRAAADPMRWFVPGRLELLGKHTDYAGGRSLLCAVERGFAVAATPRADPIVSIADVVRGTRCEIRIAPDVEIPASGWPVYPTVVARRLARDFPIVERKASLEREASGERPLIGADIAIASDLPSAAGMSSSSALLVAVFAVLSAVNDLPGRPEYRDSIDTAEDLAGYLGCVENGQPFKTLAGGGGVGTSGGSEDHTAILASEAGYLKQYAFCPVRLERRVALPADWRFVIAVSGVVADKIGTARARYNRASQAVRSILDVWRATTGSTAATLAAAIAASTDAPDQLRAALLDPGPGLDARWLSDRFEQFLLESEVIVPGAAEALARHDLEAFGELADRSQAAAEMLLGNQVPETMILAREARALGAHAASAFGAGFGGSVWALVPRDEAPAFADRWRRACVARGADRRRMAGFFVTSAGPSALRSP